MSVDARSPGSFDAHGVFECRPLRGRLRLQGRTRSCNWRRERSRFSPAVRRPRSRGAPDARDPLRLLRSVRGCRAGAMRVREHRLEASRPPLLARARVRDRCRQRGGGRTQRLPDDVAESSVASSGVSRHACSPRVTASSRAPRELALWAAASSTSATLAFGPSAASARCLALSSFSATMRASRRWSLRRSSGPASAYAAAASNGCVKRTSPSSTSTTPAASASAERWCAIVAATGGGCDERDRRSRESRSRE